jgi:hypothetical protein
MSGLLRWSRKYWLTLVYLTFVAALVVAWDLTRGAEWVAHLMRIAGVGAIALYVWNTRLTASGASEREHSVRDARRLSPQILLFGSFVLFVALFAAIEVWT